MADLDESTQLGDSGDGGVEMEAVEQVQEQDDENKEENGAGAGEGNGEGNDTTTPNGDTPPNPHNVFLDYLRSPVVELVVGSGDDATILTAHKAILTQSAYFLDKLAELLDEDKLSIDLSEESLDAMGCFLQYQYTGEYFPRRLADTPDGLEPDPSVPAIDDTGAQLLKHARVYTLAVKFGLPDLKNLAHSKIHRINSTAVGEMAYARYVYGNTPPDDVTIRRPLAAFWATRSHVLRHDAESEFKAMCLEFPQFGFDVLSLVLDQREKRTREREEDGASGAGSRRKRIRPSINI